MKPAMIGAALLLLAQAAPAAFVEDFMAPKLALDPAAHTGWATLTGAGEASLSFSQKDGVGIVAVDATGDKRNIWWAVIKRSVTPAIDARLLGRPDKALRIETRIRLLKPRRVMLSLVHTRTTDFHRDMREYDIADTDWHVISYTDKTFDATPADEVFAQLALYDAGRQRHFIEIAWFKVSIVDADTAGPDLGDPQVYNPPLPQIASFSNALAVAQDTVVDAAQPSMNFKDWTDGRTGGPLIGVADSRMILLRWDFAQFEGKTPNGWGVLALSTERSAPGMLRVVEIKGGDPNWTRATVSRRSFLQGLPEHSVLNPQLMVDVAPAKPEERTLIAVSPAVLARLLSGKTKGLAIYALGAVNAAFASSLSPDPNARPILYFNAK